jgi:long-subunit acyl-CoA synthetase (AMP-forming)
LYSRLSTLLLAVVLLTGVLLAAVLADGLLGGQVQGLYPVIHVIACFAGARDNGEVHVRGPGVFVGYYKQDDATRDAITADGWLKTGDAGLIDPQGRAYAA